MMEDGTISIAIDGEVMDTCARVAVRRETEETTSGTDVPPEALMQLTTNLL
jgi:hypothetical protein